jgi:hypothetical protein
VLRYLVGNHNASIQYYYHNKKEGIDLKTIRHISIRLVLGPEAKPIISVEVVSPTDATGHPQLTSALRRRITTNREGSGIPCKYIQSALLRLTSIVLESRDGT